MVDPDRLHGDCGGAPVTLPHGATSQADSSERLFRMPMYGRRSIAASGPCYARYSRKTSIDRYVHVFGAVPERQPYRQWLYAGRGEYIHIADVWNDPGARKHVFTLIRRKPRAWRLHDRLVRDLEYLTEFAGRQCATNDLGSAVTALRAWLGSTPAGREN